MFEVAVPEGVRPGQPFALIANGQRVMVIVPPNLEHPLTAIMPGDLPPECCSRTKNSVSASNSSE